MARGDQQRGVRRDPDLREGRRDVVLQESRRFFTARGSDQGVRQARALQQALGIGVEAYAGVLERRNIKGGAQAVQEAATGEDRDIHNTNKGYNETYDQVEAANDLALFSSELPRMLDAEGWSDLPEDMAQERIDNYFAGQLEGINPDSLYGKIVAEGILKQNAQLLDVHRKFQAEKAQQERRIMVTNEARSDYELDGTIDHEKLMKRLHTLVPGPGGRLTYVEAVIDIAEEYGAPELIESIPEYFPSGDPTGVTDQKFKDAVIDPGLSKARATKLRNDKAAVEKWKLDNQTTLAKMWSADTKMAEQGDARVLPNIAEGGTEGPNGEPRRYTREQQKTLYDKFLDASEKNDDDAILLTDWVNGDAVGYTQNEVDAAHVKYVEAIKANLPVEIEKGGEDAINDYITTLSLERGVVNGKLPSVYRDQLKVNLSNPDKFKQAAEMYSVLEAQRAGFAETQIGDAQSRKLYAYNRYLAETGGNEDNAVELMGTHEAGRNARFNAEIGKTNIKVVADISNSMPGWGDYATTSRLQRLVNDEVRFYVDMGFEPEMAGEYAIEHIQRRTRRAGDHVYAADAGWGNEPQAVYEYTLQNEAEHRGVDVETLDIIPTGDPTRVRFTSVDHPLPETKTYPITIFAEDYERFNSQQEQQRAELYDTSSAEKLAEADKRAFARRFPYESFVEPGERTSLSKMHRERWEAMPADQKKRLVQNELKP